MESEPWKQIKAEFLPDHHHCPIKKLTARQVFDSRGNPTVEVDLETNAGGPFRAIVPSGASTGTHEAVELRDNTPAAFMGKGVRDAVNNIKNTIGPKLIEKNIDVANQGEIDAFIVELDGTKNKEKLGANALLPISMAVCRACANSRHEELYKYISTLIGLKEFIMPVPAFNVINGGAHAGNTLPIQEFMILPTGATSFREAMQMGTETYHHLKKVIHAKFGLHATAIGDEGGFAPNISDSKEALELIKEAIEKAGYTGRIDIGLDVAASEFYKDGKYDLDFKNPNPDPKKRLTADQLAAMYEDFIDNYPIVSIEDPFDQEDWDAYVKFIAKTKIQIVGDDLTVTNPSRIKEAAEKKAVNCLLLKINQIGTVSESIWAHQLAQQNGWGTMVSHRSGETEDTFIADLVVGLGAGQIKAGAPCRSERVAKYNRLLRIEEELDEPRYAGRAFRNPL